MAFHYAPEYEHSIHRADEELAIEWPLSQGTTPLVSAKDNAGLSLQEAEVYKASEGKLC
jgi:dTDP-4-dehydrorhamnose 3,5-epimerase